MHYKPEVDGSKPSSHLFDYSSGEERRIYVTWKVPDIAQLVERLTVDQLVVCSIHTVRIWLELEMIHISQT